MSENTGHPVETIKTEFMLKPNCRFDNRIFLYAVVEPIDSLAISNIISKLKQLNIDFIFKRIRHKGRMEYGRFCFAKKCTKKLKQKLKVFTTEFNVKFSLCKRKRKATSALTSVKKEETSLVAYGEYDAYSLHIISFNINHLNNKVLELTEHIYIEKPDIIFIQETHRKQNDARIIVEGYTVFEHAENDMIGANGILTIIKNELIDMCSVEYSSDFLMILKFMHVGNETLSLINCYRTCRDPGRGFMLNKILELL